MTDDEKAQILTDQLKRFLIDRKFMVNDKMDPPWLSITLLRCAIAVWFDSGGEADYLVRMVFQSLKDFKIIDHFEVGSFQDSMSGTMKKETLH